MTNTDHPASVPSDSPALQPDDDHQPLRYDLDAFFLHQPSLDYERDYLVPVVNNYFGLVEASDLKLQEVVANGQRDDAAKQDDQSALEISSCPFHLQKWTVQPFDPRMLEPWHSGKLVRLPATRMRREPRSHGGAKAATRGEPSQSDAAPLKRKQLLTTRHRQLSDHHGRTSTEVDRGAATVNKGHHQRGPTTTTTTTEWRKDDGHQPEGDSQQYDDDRRHIPVDTRSIRRRCDSAPPLPPAVVAINLPPPAFESVVRTPAAVDDDCTPTHQEQPVDSSVVVEQVKKLCIDVHPDNGAAEEEEMVNELATTAAIARGGRKHQPRCRADLGGIAFKDARWYVSNISGDNVEGPISLEELRRNIVAGTRDLHCTYASDPKGPFLPVANIKDQIFKSACSQQQQRSDIDDINAENFLLAAKQCGLDLKAELANLDVHMSTFVNTKYRNGFEPPEMGDKQSSVGRSTAKKDDNEAGFRRVRK